MKKTVSNSASSTTCQSLGSAKDHRGEDILSNVVFMASSVRYSSGWHAALVLMLNDCRRLLRCSSEVLAMAEEGVSAGTVELAESGIIVSGWRKKGGCCGVTEAAMDGF